MARIGKSGAVAEWPGSPTSRPWKWGADTAELNTDPTYLPLPLPSAYPHPTTLPPRPSLPVHTTDAGSVAQNSQRTHCARHHSAQSRSSLTSHFSWSRSLFCGFTVEKHTRKAFGCPCSAHHPTTRHAICHPLQLPTNPLGPSRFSSSPHGLRCSPIRPCTLSARCGALLIPRAWRASSPPPPTVPQRLGRLVKPRRVCLHGLSAPAQVLAQGVLPRG